MTTPTEDTLFDSELSLPLLKRGKVRDIYDLGGELLLVATDRLSAFDVVFAEPIPAKGRVLTAMSHYWFERFRDHAENHMVEVPIIGWLRQHSAEPERYLGRCMRVRKCEPIKLECIVRGYLEGSAWKEYQETGTVQGHKLKPGLQLHDRLSRPLFTPSTKAEEGHDENLTFAQACDLVGEKTASRLRDLSTEIYAQAAQRTEEAGIILADTKFEFGLEDQKIIWIDEALTPDSSRFLAKSKDGTIIPFDKQFVRDWAEETGWNKQAPAPALPAEVIDQTSRRYRQIARLITGKEI